MSFQNSLVASGQAQLPANIKPAAKAPVQYEQAVKALEACQTLDEARCFDNAADALAAWAKVYADDRVSVEARRLKLHAYRRIGILAEKLRPPVPGRKGPQSLLTESGFKPNQAQGAVKIARMPRQDFEREVARPVPRAPGQLVQIGLRPNPGAAALASRFQGLLSALRRDDLGAVVDSMSDDELAGCKFRITELLEKVGALRQRIDQKIAASRREQRG